MPTTDVEIVPEPSELFRLSVQQYHAMIRIGVFADDERVELIEGVLIGKCRKTPLHSFVNKKLLTVMDRILPAGWHFQGQNPITLADGEPEPDGAVIRGSADDYPRRHPRPREAPLVIEVADTALRKDRGMKLRTYARAKIGEYWIVNLVDRVVEVYTRPGRKDRTATYLEMDVKTSGDQLRLPVDGAVMLAVSEILP